MTLQEAAMRDQASFSSFMAAVLAENVSAMEQMIASGFDPNCANEDGETAFSYACANNKLLSAEFLFKQGVNINSIDKGGGTPLDWAVCWSSPEFREWLRSIGGTRNASH